MTAPANSTAGNARPTHCARCGGAFGVSDEPALCDAEGRRLALHFACAPENSGLIGIWRGATFVDFRGAGVGGMRLAHPDGGPSDDTVENHDVAWFRDHPDRCHRLRLPFPGELEAHGRTSASIGGPAYARVIVRQIVPGKLAYQFVHALPLESDDEEALAHLHFELWRNHTPGTRFSLAELQQMLRVYSAWGGRQ